MRSSAPSGSVRSAAPVAENAYSGTPLASTPIRLIVVGAALRCTASSDTPSARNASTRRAPSSPLETPPRNATLWPMRASPNATFSGEPPMRASSAMPVGVVAPVNTSIRASPATTNMLVSLSDSNEGSSAPAEHHLAREGALERRNGLQRGQAQAARGGEARRVPREAAGEEIGGADDAPAVG